MLLVFGSTGQVAQELRSLKPEARYLSRAEVDLTDPTACYERVRGVRPEAVLNAAAYTAVDKAEEEKSLATVVNAEAPSAMAKACAELSIPFVHISTDYVFDGSGFRPRAPNERVAPVNTYGATKEEGERLIRKTGAVHAILRTSWVFSRHGNNFPKTMLRLAESRDRLSVVADQIGGPTPAYAIANACLTIAETLVHSPELSGTYHLSGSPDTSWADFARAIFAEAGLSTDVVDIPSRDFPTPAARPLNSRLDCTDLARFDLRRPRWREYLQAVIDQTEKA